MKASKATLSPGNPAKSQRMSQKNEIPECLKLAGVVTHEKITMHALKKLRIWDEHLAACQML